MPPGSCWRFRRLFWLLLLLFRVFSGFLFETFSSFAERVDGRLAMCEDRLEKVIQNV